MHSDKKSNKPAKTLLTSKPKKRKDEGHDSETKKTGYAAQY
jgi:hypothetical protein